MTITFKDDSEVIVYAFDKLISYARRTQQIFVAQCIWWLVSIIGLEAELIAFIDKSKSRCNVTVIPEGNPSVRRTISPIPRDDQEDQRQDKIREVCEEYLRDSKRLREIAALKATGKTLSGFINPTAISKRHLDKSNRTTRKQSDRLVDQTNNDNSRLAGIDRAELRRREKERECLRCAFPDNRKGSHRTADCRRSIRLKKGTAFLPKTKGYLKIKEATQLVPEESGSSNKSSGEESFDDSL